MLERVTFANARGDALVGVLAGTIAPRMAILCHGMLSTKDGHKHVALAQALSAAGVASLRFDFAGRGESGGALFDLSFSNQMADLDAAVEYLGRRGAAEVVVFGSSMGGAVAYLTAARDERIVGIASLAALGHPERISELHPEAYASFVTHGYAETPAGRVGRGFLDDAVTHDVIAAVGILRAPIYVVHGDADTVVPCSDAHDIATAARHASLELIEGADHQFTNPVHLRPALAGIAAFMAQRVRAKA